jgi:hypothetical protein
MILPGDFVCPVIDPRGCLWGYQRALYRDHTSMELGINLPRSCLARLGTGRAWLALQATLVAEGLNLQIQLDDCLQSTLVVPGVEGPRARACDLGACISCLSWCIGLSSQAESVVCRRIYEET